MEGGSGLKAPGSTAKMAVQFAVLASGSRGNATLIRSGGTGLLVDLGIGPRALSQRLESVGSSLDAIASAVLTHTHGDHVDDGTLNALAKRGATLYCHENHRSSLARHAGFEALDSLGLVRHYDDRPFLTPTGFSVEPLELRHDGATYGFRVEAKPGRNARTVGFGYVADTGSWSHEMADRLSDIDLLGLEFNHDVEMQRLSGRSPYLIRRNLGDHGHLSNLQAADFVTAILNRSRRGALKDLVLLHMSQQCNSTSLALRTARAAIRGAGRRVKVHAALQAPAHPNLWVEAARRRSIA